MGKTLEFTPLNDGTCCIEVRYGDTSYRSTVIQQNWFYFNNRPCDPDRVFQNVEELAKSLRIVEYFNSPDTA